MSDRRNAARYTGAPDIGFPTTPQGGGTGLLSLLTGNDPKSLLKQSQGFASQENEKGRQHETEINNLLHQHEIEMQKLQSQLAQEIAKTQYAIQQAGKEGITPEDWANKVAPLATEKAIQNAKNEIESTGSKEVKDATTRGMAAQKLAPTVPLTAASKLQAPMGGVDAGTDYASGRPLPDVAKGSLPTQNVSMAPTMIDPNTGKAMMFSPVTTQGNIPSSFTPGMGTGGNTAIPPMDPSIRAAILNNQSQSGMTPPDSMPTTPNAFPPNPMFDNAPRTNAQPTIPIPANAQTNNGAPKNPYAAYGGYGINPQTGQVPQNQQDLLKQQLQELISKLQPTVPSNVNPLQPSPWGQLQMP